MKGTRHKRPFSCAPTVPTVSGQRRALLLGCLSWPLASILTGCGGGSSDLSTADASAVKSPTPSSGGVPSSSGLNVPLAPYAPSTAPTTSPAPAATGPAPVTHVPATSPSQSAGPLTMNVGIYNLEYNSWTQISARKQVPAGTAGAVTYVDPTTNKSTTYESITDYLTRALNDRFALLYRGLVAAFAQNPPTAYDVSFFTAPEFYWNVPWSDFLNTAEIEAAAALCLSTVTAHVRTLIALFPACTYGNLVFLPGTIAELTPATDALKPDGTYAGSVNSAVYNATNHVVCVHNLPLNDAKHPRPAYMIWPKRVVSHIDFVDEANNGDCTYNVTSLQKNPSDSNVSNNVESCPLNIAGGLTVDIQFVTPDMAQSFDSNGNLLSTGFDNNIVPGLPFGIDICLDYADASIESDKARIGQLDNSQFKLDFLLACGMSLSSSSYQNCPFVQYAIHNDGMPQSNENPDSSTLYSDVEKIIYDKTDNMVDLYLLPPAGSNSSHTSSEGLIPVDESTAFAPPAGTNTTGIPAIPDKMNPANMRVWTLPVDVSDTLASPVDLAAMKPTTC